MKVIYYLLLTIALSSCMYEVQVGAVVKEKAAGYNRNAAEFQYHTIVQTDDGYIEDITGIKAYAYPIGARMTVTVLRKPKPQTK